MTANDMSDLIAELERLITERPEDSLAASIDVLLRRMRASSARCLRLCAIPHQFDVETLKVLAPEMTDAEAEEEIKRLSKLSIVRVRGESRDYPLSLANSETEGDEPVGIFDLALSSAARRYLFNKWLKTEESRRVFKSASLGMVKYLEDQVAGAELDALDRIQFDRVFHLLGADQEKGFAEFEHLFCELRRRFRFNDCERLVKLAHEYDTTLTPARVAWLFYHQANLEWDRGRKDPAEDLLREVLTFEDTPFELQIRCIVQLSKIDIENRRWKTAIQQLKNALKLINVLDGQDERQDLRWQASHSLGVAYRESGNLMEAERLLSESVDLSVEEGNQRFLATSFNSLGILYQKMGEIEKAIAVYKKSLGCLEKSGDKFRGAQIHNNIGLAYLAHREWEQSRLSFHHSLEIKREAGDTAGQAKTLNNLMQTYRNLSADEQAIKTAKLAITLFEEVNDRYDAALVKRNLARLYRKMKRKDEARPLFHEALNDFEKIELQDEIRGEKRLRNRRRAGKHEHLEYENASEPGREIEIIKEELRHLDIRFWLPWWMWLAITLFILFAVWFLRPFFERFLIHP